MNLIERKIGGELRAFRFGVGFLGEILDVLNTDIEGLGKEMARNPYKVIPLVLFLGYRSERELENLPMDIELSDVHKWLEEVDGSYSAPIVMEITKCMMDNVLKYLPKAEVDEEEDPGPKTQQKRTQKKRSTGKKT